MKELTITLPNSGRIVPVTLVRRRMKSCRIKVDPAGTVTLSLPLKAPAGWAVDFLRSRCSWVEERLDHYSALTAAGGIDHVDGGKPVRFLGEELAVQVVPGKAEVRKTDGVLRISCPQPEDGQAVQRVFDRWWHDETLSLLTRAVARFYPLVADRAALPPVKVRRMKTRWGSCNTTAGRITFSLYLAQAPGECVDYVVLHELTHLRYPDHGPGFYGFLSQNMPDWKARRDRLNGLVVPGV